MNNKDYHINGKLVGQLLGDTYFTTRYSKPHYYVKGKGYPISEKILIDLVRRQAKNIIVREFNSKQQKTVYKTPLTNYLKSDLFKQPNYDEQRCYPLRQMQVILKPQPKIEVTLQ